MGKKFTPKKRLRTERINDRILAIEVRCVGEHVPNNTTNGVMYITKVKELAKELELDVVEISRNSNPPVVKIMDYSKFLYEKKRKLKDTSKSKVITKEVQISPFIGDADLRRKENDARKFLKKGYKVKLTAQTGGRNMEGKLDEIMKIALNMFINLEDVGITEAVPKISGRRMVGLIKPLTKNN